MFIRIARTLPVIGFIGAITLLCAGCAAVNTPPTIVGTWGSEASGQPTLTFNDNGTVTGTDGCNGISTTYRVDDNRIVVDRFASTLMACQGVDPWLNAISSAVIDGDVLVIENAAGARIGELARATGETSRD